MESGFYLLNLESKSPSNDQIRHIILRVLPRCGSIMKRFEFIFINDS